MNRLFRTQLDTTPGRFYMNLRLDRARALLQQTVMSVLEVSVACGFASSSHFIRCYRARFGRTPSAEHGATAPCSAGVESDRKDCPDKSSAIIGLGGPSPTRLPKRVIMTVLSYMDYKRSI